MGAAVIPGFVQGGRDVFVLNVPSSECLGLPSAPFGLGWISQGGEEMEQSSTHILRQFHAGFLKNANAFFFLFFFLILEVSDLHRPPCPSVPPPGQEAAPGAGAAAFCPPAKRDPPHLGTGAPVFPQPLGMPSASGEGKTPKEVIKRGRGILPSHDKRRSEAVFSPEVMFEARPWFLRAWERAVRMMLLVEPAAASRCESGLPGPGHGTAGTPGSPHGPGPHRHPGGLPGVQPLGGILVVRSLLGSPCVWGAGCGRRGAGGW